MWECSEDLPERFHLTIGWVRCSRYNTDLILVSLLTVSYWSYWQSVLHLRLNRCKNMLIWWRRMEQFILTKYLMFELYFWKVWATNATGQVISISWLRSQAIFFFFYVRSMEAWGDCVCWGWGWAVAPARLLLILLAQTHRDYRLPSVLRGRSREAPTPDLRVCVRLKWIQTGSRR